MNQVERITYFTNKYSEFIFYKKILQQYYLLQ